MIKDKEEMQKLIEEIEKLKEQQISQEINY